MTGNGLPQRCDDGGGRAVARVARSRSRGFAHLRATACVLAPLALILLTGSARQGQQGGEVKGRVIDTTGRTSTGTTSTGTSGTSGTTGTDPDGTGINVGDLQRIEEIRAARSVRVASGAIVTDLARHVVRLKLRIRGDAMPDVTLWENLAAAIEAAPTGVGEIGSADAPATPAVVQAGTDHMFANPQGVGGHDGFDLRGYLVTRPPSGTNPSQDWYLYPQIGSDAILSGGQLRIRIVLRKTVQPQDGQPEVNHYLVESVLDVSKLPCEAVSLDSRKAYGQPNLEGVLPADPNAGLDHIGFRGWTYKGGVFVGNMPPGTGDLSGEGRLQARYTGTMPSSTYVGSCLTAFATERKAVYGTQANPSAMQTPVVGLYRPRVGNPSDPNLDAGEDARWGTRWDIAPQEAAGNPVDWSKTAYHWFELTDAMQGQYANWQMPYKPTSTSAGSTEMWRYAALAPRPPARTAWQSFSTAQYQSVQGAQFPITDSAPRFWRVGQVSSDNGGNY